MLDNAKNTFANMYAFSEGVTNICNFLIIRRAGAEK